MNTDEIKQKLTEEKALLERELSDVAVADSENPGGYVGKEPDMNDENPADVLEEGHEQEVFSRNQAITNDLEMRLVNINKALDALENHRYGVCNKGGEDHPIEEDRLEANPAATTCKDHM